MASVSVRYKIMCDIPTSLEFTFCLNNISAELRRFIGSSNKSFPLRVLLWSPSVIPSTSRALLALLSVIESHRFVFFNWSFFFKLQLIGFDRSWPGKKSNSVVFALRWRRMNLRCVWVLKELSLSIMSSIYRHSKGPSTKLASRSWSKAVLKATTLRFLHMAR